MPVAPVRAFHLNGDAFAELPGLPAALPPDGFVWLALARDALADERTLLHRVLADWQVPPLFDLHVSDLLNTQLPSHFDSTSWYDLLVIRRLRAAVPAVAGSAGSAAAATAVPVAAADLRAPADVDTSPVGFVVFDRLLVTVHPGDCAVRDFFVARLALLAQRNGHEPRAASRLPTSPADLMLRMVNHIVDGYLELRRLLTRQQSLLEQQLLDPKNRFADWSSVMASRTALIHLEDICEDQRSAVLEWIDVLEEWPDPGDDERRRERELLRVRSRDVLEHVERVLGHVRRLEEGTEAAVQMHFSAVGHRTNAIMRTLTVLTAVFLPLNLITGFFGMNFERLPLIHSSTGVWLTIGAMVAIVAVLLAVFWRKHYLETAR